MTVLENFDPYDGQHCETTTTGCLLKHIGIELSEPMLFGLGEGFGFIFWKMKGMDFPFIGGRIKTDLLTKNICQNLNLQLEIKETRSVKKAWSNVAGPIARGAPVGLKLDCFHLDYFTNKIHFAGHYVAMYGFDDTDAFLVDTRQQGGVVKTSLENLALARAEKGPMSSKNLTFTITQTAKLPKLEQLIPMVIANNAREYLNPAITNFTYKGILKTSKEIVPWFQTSSHRKRDFETTAMLMERAGTGGSLFRNFYRDFLAEAAGITDQAILKTASEKFHSIAARWSEVANCFQLAGETDNIKHIESAAEILITLAADEQAAMVELHNNVKTQEVV